MLNPAAGDLFDGRLLPALAGALWAWLLALLVGAALLPRREDDEGGGALLTWLVLGVAVVAQVWLGAGLLGLLRPAWVLAAAVALTVAGALLGGRRILSALRAADGPGPQAPPPRGDGGAGEGLRWLGPVAGLVLGAFLVLVFRLAMWPTVFYDDLVYHVGLPRQALLTGSWPALPGLHYSFMPAGWDAAYVLPLALGGGNGPQIMNVVALALFAWAAYRLARLGASPGAAAASAALLVVAPMTGSLGAFAGNDLFVGLALCVAIERLVATRGERPVAAGLLGGAAWSAKYSALPVCAGLALAAAVLRKGPATRRAAAALAVGGATALVGLAWNVRSFVLTGNPLYPAFYGVLGGRYWSSESAAAVAEQVSHGGFGDRGAAAFVLALRDVLFRSDALGYPSGVNPLFVVLGLAGLVLWRRVRGAPALVVLLAVGYAGWCATSLNLRYALPLLAALTPFAGALIESGADRMTRVLGAPVARASAAALLLVALAGPFAGAANRHARLYRASLVGDTPRHEMHVTRLHLAAAAREMASTLPAEARILLVGEGRLGLLPRPALASSAYDRPDIERFVRGAGSVERVNERLSDFTHVVVNHRELERFRQRYGFAERFAPADWELFRRWLDRGLEPVAQHGNVTVYRIPRGEERS